MKLAIRIELDSGGTVLIKGEGLSAEDVNEVFRICSGHVVSSWTKEEASTERGSDG